MRRDKAKVKEVKSGGKEEENLHLLGVASGLASGMGAAMVPIQSSASTIHSSAFTVSILRVWEEPNLLEVESVHELSLTKE